MLAGLVWSGKIRFFTSIDVTALTASGTGATAGGVYTVYGRTWQIGRFGVLADGIYSKITSSKGIGGVDSYEYELIIPSLSISHSISGASWKPSVLSRITLRLDVYQDYRSPWYVEFGDTVWDVDGSSNTYSGTNILHTGLTPQFLHLLGTPWMVKPDISPSPQHSNPVCSSWDVGGAMEAQVLGGYEIWDNLAPVPAWEAMPIYWSPIHTPAAPGAPFGLDCSGITVGNTTGTCGLDLTVEGRTVNSRYRTSYYQNGDGEQRAGWFGVVPDLTRRIERATEADYRALITRGGFPGVEEVGSHRWGDTTSITVGGMGTLSNGPDYAGDILAPYNADLQTVGDAVTRIDEPLAIPHVPMIVALAHAKSEIVGPGINVGGGCSDNGIDPPAYESNIGESVTYQSVREVDAYAGGSGMFEYLQQGITTTTPIAPTGFGDYDGKDAIARYWSYWSHPHWSYVFHPRDMSVDASSVAWKDYPYPLGTQWLDHPALPAGDRRKSRTDLISMHGIEGGNTSNGGYVENFISGANYPTSYWGNWRYLVNQWALSVSLSLTSASSARWEIKDGGGTVLASVFGGSDVSVTVGAGDVIARILLASFTEEGYFYPSIAQRFEVLRDTATVDRIRVYLEGADGSLVELDETDVQAAGGANWPASGLLSTKNAGTWGQDYGCGAVTDTGVDLLGSGESATVNADTVRSSVFQLLPGRTAKYLKIVATPKAATSPIKLKYPKFYAPTATPQVQYIGRQLTAIIWPGGSGVLMGTWNFWDYTFDVFQATPTVLPIGSKSTILDAICTRNLFEGKASDDGLDAEIAGLFISGIEYGPGAERISVAYQTIAWWVISEGKVSAALQNTYTPPPIAYFPPRLRDSDFLETDDRGLETIDWAQEPRRLISPSGDQIGEFLLSPLTEWTAPSAGIASGWTGREHSHIVDNAEDLDDYRIRGITDGVNYAKRRPWHGAFAVLGIGAATPATWVSNAWSPFGHFHETSEAGGNILYRRVDGPFPSAAGFAIDVQVTSAGTDTHPRCAVSAMGTAVLVFDRSGSGSVRTVSYDDGATWESPAVIAAMGKYPITWFDEVGYEGYAWFEYNSGSSGPGQVKLKTRGPGESAFGATITHAVDVEDSGFGITAPPSFQNAWVLSAIKDGDSLPTRFLSFDQGATWEEV